MFSFIFQAIRDGVIEAVLDHENGWMQSKENSDIYCTREPQLGKSIYYFKITPLDGACLQIR